MVETELDACIGWAARVAAAPASGAVPVPATVNGVRLRRPVDTEVP